MKESEGCLGEANASAPIVPRRNPLFPLPDSRQFSAHIFCWVMKTIIKACLSSREDNVCDEGQGCVIIGNKEFSKQVRKRNPSHPI